MIIRRPVGASALPLVTDLGPGETETLLLALESQDVRVILDDALARRMAKTQGIRGMMWNPIATARFLPGQFIPAAKAAHGGEALLAVIAIIIWHMWSVHLRHFNKSMWTGSLTEEEMLHEHPLELADLKAGVAERPVDAVTLKNRRQIFFPVAGVASAALLIGVYFFPTFEQTAITTLLPTPA